MTALAEDHNRELDPGFEEDPDIFVVLEDGVFYQASYDGTEVAIIADYPGLLPASHVSNQETSRPKEFSHSASPTAPSCAQKGGVRRAMLPRGISQESGPHTGQAFEEEGK